MSEPMRDEDFLRSMWLSFAPTQVDARKLIMADPDLNWLSQDIIEKMISRYPGAKADNEYGYADLALEATICKEDILEKVLTVDKVRKELRKKLGRDYDVPAIKSKMTGLFEKSVSCGNESDKEAIMQEAYKMYDEILGKGEVNVSWSDFFAADSLDDEIRILQELYMGLLEPEEILKFLVYNETDSDIIMQEIYRLEKERISRVTVDDYYEVVKRYIRCKDEFLKEAWEDKVLELENEIQQGRCLEMLTEEVKRVAELSRKLHRATSVQEEQEIARQLEMDFTEEEAKEYLSLLNTAEDHSSIS